VSTLQTCNVFLSDSTGAFLYGFGSAGVTPCRFQVENNGTVEVIDSKNVVWSTNGVPTGPVAGSGVLAPGQTLTQASAPPWPYPCRPACVKFRPLWRAVSGA
jgi:hypothetical protein